MAAQRRAPKLDKTYTVGDTRPDIVGTVKDTDLSAATVTLRLKRPDDTVVTLTSIAVAGEADDGFYRFRWGAGDLIEGRNQRATIKIDDGSGGIETSDIFEIDVEDEV